MARNANERTGRPEEQSVLASKSVAVKGNKQVRSPRSFFSTCARLRAKGTHAHGLETLDAPESRPPQTVPALATPLR